MKSKHSLLMGLKPLVWAAAIEGVVLITVVIGLHMTAGEASSVSAVFGGLLFIIPNTYFMIYAFKFQGSARIAQAAQSLNKGLMGKFTLTALGFALVFSANPDILPQVLLSVYCLLWAVHLMVARRVSNYYHEICQKKDS